MKILSVQIERESGMSCCGTMEILTMDGIGHLLWTIEYRDREVRLEVFPCGQVDPQVLEHNRQCISEQLLDTLGGKTLVHGR